MTNASRDPNRVTSLLGVSSVDNTTPTTIAVDPTTHGMIIDGTSLYTGLDPRYVLKAGDTMTGPLGIGIGTPRAGSQFDIKSTATGTIPNVVAGSLTINYGNGTGNYTNDGYSFQYSIYAFRTFNSTKVFSSILYSLSGSDDSNGGQIYTVDLSWTAVTGAEGYRIVVANDTWYGASGNYYFDVVGTSVQIDGGDCYLSGNTVTPTSTTAGADFYVNDVGDLISIRNLYFNNRPTLSLGNSNGLSLSGIYNYSLTLPTTAKVKLGGLSLGQSYTAGYNQLIFPQGAGGSSAPGIRFLGGQTDGGLAMNDGILEFWNNFSEYCTPVSGHIQGVFRIDTRSGYETESFTIGGKDGSGTQFTILTANHATGDVNLAPWGNGSVAIGEEMPSSPVTGLNGCLSVHNSIYVGKDIIVQDATNGMKIGTATTQKLGFWNKTPVVQPSAYTVTNPSADRAFDVSSTSVNELAKVVGTIITDLQALGLVG